MKIAKIMNYSKFSINKPNNLKNAKIYINHGIQTEISGIALNNNNRDSILFANPVQRVY